MARIFIDGQAGTTGLQIADRLATRDDLELLTIAECERKSASARAALMARSDLTILCLPDAAVPQAVALAAGRCRLLDASSVHRTDPDWVYGLPELGDAQRAQISAADRVSNPGCYPQGFILCVRPLLQAGLLDAAKPLSCHAVSGYSGGGRALIERFAGFDAATAERLAYQSYALSLAHKHVPEMQRYSGLAQQPLFAPAVGNFYQGMLTQVPLFVADFAHPGSLADIESLWVEAYRAEPFVRVRLAGAQDPTTDGYLNATACNQTNGIELMAFGNEAQCLLLARYDNLGKGAAGVAVQNLNLMLGLPEVTGLPVLEP